MFLLNGKPLQIDTPFECNGIQYPATWLRMTTLAEKEAIGITEVPDISIDDRFYYISMIGEPVPKDLDSVKLRFKQDVKRTAASMLNNTDWYLIRKMDTGKEVPNNIKIYRDQVRQVLTILESSIETSTSIEDLQTVVNNMNSQWPTLES